MSGASAAGARGVSKSWARLEGAILVGGAIAHKKEFQVGENSVCGIL
jgi:hypothetical protein